MGFPILYTHNTHTQTQTHTHTPTKHTLTHTTHALTHAQTHTQTRANAQTCTCAHTHIRILLIRFVILYLHFISTLLFVSQSRVSILSWPLTTYIC